MCIPLRRSRARCERAWCRTGSLPRRPGVSLCVAQVHGNRKGDARAGVTKGLLIRLGIGIVHASMSEQCPRSSARIEQRPPEPCVGRSNRLGGTSSQSLNHSCRPSTVLCYLVSALAKCPFHTYTASTYILASFPRKRESRRRRAGGLDARLRGHDVLLVPDLRNGHLVPLPPAAFLLLLTCKILSTACMTCNMVVIHTRWLGSGCKAHSRVGRNPRDGSEW